LQKTYIFLLLLLAVSNLPATFMTQFMVRQFTQVSVELEK
jgi:hypothetical protein